MSATVPDEVADPEPAAGSGWNPYLEEYHRWVPPGYNWLDSSTWPGAGDERYDRILDSHGARRHLNAKYAFGVPGEAALSTIAEYAPIVELGAGIGYWARCLRERGVDVIAYDLFGEDWQRWFQPSRLERDGRYLHNVIEEGAEPRLWTEVLRGDVNVLLKHPDRALQLVWPTYADPFAERALQAYRGQRVIYVGEGDGGCTGTERFHELLGREWEEIADAPVPQWDGLHDHLWVYERQ